MFGPGWNDRTPEQQQQQRQDQSSSFQQQRSAAQGVGGTATATPGEHHNNHRTVRFDLDLRQQQRQIQDNERRMQIQTTNRLNQLFEENDHKRCSDGNAKALLAEELESLRRLVNELEKDDWQYKMQNSAELLAMHHDSNYFADAPPG